MWSRCFYTLFISFKNSFKYVSHRKKQANDSSKEAVKDEEAIVIVKNRLVVGRREGGKYDLGHEVHVEEGKDYEAEVFNGDHAGGGEHHHQSEGVELLEGEYATEEMGFWLPSGAWCFLFVFGFVSNYAIVVGANPTRHFFPVAFLCEIVKRFY